jgi:hypothetical protein
VAAVSGSPSPAAGWAEAARIVAFVAGPAAALMTGTNVVADGGLTTRIPI